MLLLALSVLAVGAASPAAAKPSTSTRSAPTIRVLDANLAAVLHRHTLRVSVRAARAGRFRLFATALPASGRGAPVTITRIAAVQLRARHTTAVSLRLLAAGRRALAGCGARTPPRGAPTGPGAASPARDPAAR